MMIIVMVVVFVAIMIMGQGSNVCVGGGDVYGLCGDSDDSDFFLIGIADGDYGDGSSDGGAGC